VERIAEAWSDQKCEPITVSFREDGELYLVDGMQRYLAAKLIGKSNLMGRIMTGLTEEEEMLLFRDQNKNRVTVSAYDKLRAEASLGMKDGVDILRICRECDVPLRSVRKCRIGECGCAGQVTKTYQAIGEDGLKWIFETIEELQWKHEAGGYASIFIKNLTILYREHTDHKKLREVLIKNYGELDPENVKALALRRYGYRKRNYILAMLRDACLRVK